MNEKLHYTKNMLMALCVSAATISTAFAGNPSQNDCDPMAVVKACASFANCHPVMRSYMEDQCGKILGLTSESSTRDEFFERLRYFGWEKIYRLMCADVMGTHLISWSVWPNHSEIEAPEMTPKRLRNEKLLRIMGKLAGGESFPKNYAQFYSHETARQKLKEGLKVEYQSYKSNHIPGDGAPLYQPPGNPEDFDPANGSLMKAVRNWIEADMAAYLENRWCNAIAKCTNTPSVEEYDSFWPLSAGFFRYDRGELRLNDDLVRLQEVNVSDDRAQSNILTLSVKSRPDMNFKPLLHIEIPRKPEGSLRSSCMYSLRFHHIYDFMPVHERPGRKSYPRIMQWHRIVKFDIGDDTNRERMQFQVKFAPKGTNLSLVRRNAASTSPEALANAVELSRKAGNAYANMQRLIVAPFFCRKKAPTDQSAILPLKCLDYAAEFIKKQEHDVLGRPLTVFDLADDWQFGQAYEIIYRLKEVVQKHPGKETDPLWQSLQSFMTHKELQDSNILVHNDGKSPAFSLIDTGMMMANMSGKYKDYDHYLKAREYFAPGSFTPYDLGFKLYLDAVGSESTLGFMTGYLSAFPRALIQDMTDVFIFYAMHRARYYESHPLSEDFPSRFDANMYICDNLLDMRSRILSYFGYEQIESGSWKKPNRPQSKKSRNRAKSVPTQMTEGKSRGRTHPAFAL